MRANSYVKIWEVEEDDKVCTVKMSTSRKVNPESSYDKNLIDKGVAKNGYVSTSWAFVRFVGKASNKIKKHFNENPDSLVITNLDYSIEREPFWGTRDDGTEGIVYPKNIKFTVFDFELVGETTPTNNIDKAPELDAESSNTTNEVAEDDCPF